MKQKQQKKKKGRSVQELMGIKTFTKYGLSTNKGEWKFDPEEGIDHAAFHQKEPIPSRMAEAIQDGMQQTDSNYRLQSFSYSVQNKALTVQVTADSGEAAAFTANI